jgi:hypothetical protein
MEEVIERLLDNSLDYGIKEFDFWEMTPAEIDRYIKSRNRVRKIEAQQRASFDYILASLISKGTAIIMGSKESFPTVEEAYPDLFSDLQKKREEKIIQQKMNLSALRFKQFAQSYNSKFKDKEVPTNE